MVPKYRRLNPKINWKSVFLEYAGVFGFFVVAMSLLWLIYSLLFSE